MANAFQTGKGDCRLELIMNVYDEDGNIISDIPKGSWFQLSREAANEMARSLTMAVVGVTAQWEEARKSTGGPKG